jgi:iron complex transport system ATP-binding protein
MAEIMKIQNLYSGYGNGNIINGIDLNIEKGELVGIIGPNGSGKTTLLRTMTGILKPQNGKILIDSENLSKISHREIAKKIAVVKQNIEQVMLTINDYVLMGRFPYYNKFQFFEKQKDLELSNKYMRLTDVYELRHKLMSDISGGERQRAQIAKALAQEPAILLLDEPTSQLDIAHQIKILDLIKSLNLNMGFTVIMVIHDLNMASEYCSKLIMLKSGRVFKSGTPNDVLTYQNVEEVYNAVVIVQTNPLTGRPYIIPVTEEAKSKKILKEPTP